MASNHYENTINGFACRFIEQIIPEKRVILKNVTLFSPDAKLKNTDVKHNLTGSEYIITVSMTDGVACRFRQVRIMSSGTVRTVLPLTLNDRLHYESLTLLRHNCMALNRFPDYAKKLEASNGALLAKFEPGASWHIHHCGTCGRKYIKDTALTPCPYCSNPQLK